MTREEVMNEIERQVLASPGKGTATYTVRGVPSNSVWALFQVLAQRGRLHRSKVSHKLVVWFATAEAKEVFERSRVNRVRASATPSVTVPKRGSPWAPGTEAIITPKTIFTICPSPGRALRSNTHGELG